MLKGVGWILGAVLLGVVALALYNHTIGNTVSTSGEVISHNGPLTPTDTSNIDGGATPTPSPSPAAAATTTTTPDAASTPPPNANTTLTTTPAAPATPAPAGVPSADTLTPAAPNGMAFGGSGRFQWYRQGNLTWRIDTRSGETCIDFATMDEWARPIVYRHGCRRA